MSLLGTDTFAAAPHVGDLSGGDLKGLMFQMMQHLAKAEQRNEVLLADMTKRLEALSQGARTTRARVPNDYLPGFERIEDGIHLLADRIAASYIARQSPTSAPASAAPVSVEAAANLVEAPFEAYVPKAPHASAASAFEHVHALSSISPGSMRVRSAPYAANIDTFDVIESLPGNPNEAWSSDEAAALAQVYSAQDALFAQPDDLADPVTAVDAVTSAPTATPNAHDLSHHDRNWIDDRLTDIAARVERSLSAAHADFSPSNMMGSLDTRFEDIERRLTIKLGGVATKSDLAGLTVIEDQIHTLRHQFEQAHVELLRIDDLERQLGQLVQQVSDENLSAVISRAVPVPNPAIVPRADVEFHGVAIAAAEAAAARVSRLQGTGRVDDVHALLSSFISERRQGEEQTAITLDTLQQAMLRILDRVETFEQGTAPAGSFLAQDGDHHDAAHEHDHHAGPIADGHEYADAHDRSYDHRLAEAVAAPEPIPAVDYLSQQRAKMQASVQRAAAAQRDKTKVATEATLAGANARMPRPAKPAAKAAGPGRLMVSMLALAVIAGGAAAVVMALPRDGTNTIASSLPAFEAPAPVAGLQPAPRRPPPIEAAAPSFAAPNQLAQDHDASIVAQPNPMPETVTDDIGQSGRIPEIDRVPEVGSARANLARSQYTVPSAVSGVLLQKSGNDADVISPPVVAARPALALNAVTIAAHPGDMPTAAREAVETEKPRSSLELPPATVGPLSLRLAAARGDKSAQFEVASRLAEGKGTDQNLKEAVRWYQRSATQGFTQAQYRLGTFYERGLGIKADAGRARIWYQRAAEQGNVKAMHNLAVLAAGRSAESPDYGTAAHWFTQAAGYGLADSQFNLAVLTESGLGVEKDLVQAAMWFSVAARSGDKEAIRRRDLMKSKLSAGDLAKAEQLVKAWQPLVQEKLANDPHAAGEAWKSVQAQPVGQIDNN